MENTYLLENIYLLGAHQFTQNINSHQQRSEKCNMFTENKLNIPTASNHGETIDRPNNEKTYYILLLNNKQYAIKAYYSIIRELDIR